MSKHNQCYITSLSCMGPMYQPMLCFDSKLKLSDWNFPPLSNPISTMDWQVSPAIFLTFSRMSSHTLPFLSLDFNSQSRPQLKTKIWEASADQIVYTFGILIVVSGVRLIILQSLPKEIGLPFIGWDLFKMFRIADSWGAAETWAQHKPEAPRTQCNGNFDTNGHYPSKFYLCWN